MPKEKEAVEVVSGVKPGNKTSEFSSLRLGLIASMVIAIIPVVLDKIPPDSIWVVVLGALLAIATSVATYMGGRSYVKGKASLGEGLKKIADSNNKKKLDPDLN